MQIIDSFTGEYSYLSNFSNHGFMYDGIVYMTNEHFYQAMKATKREVRAEIAAEPTPGRAKRAGQKLDLRPDWEEVKLRVMERGVKLKFLSNTLIYAKLIATNDAYLAEGNNWGDTYWGVCNGSGQNHLGKILMKVRTELLHK